MFAAKLQASGRPGADPNTVHIRILSISKPEPYQEPKDITAYRLARRSSNPALREMAETVAAFSWNLHLGGKEEGRKGISAFNLISIDTAESELKPRQLGPTTEFSPDNENEPISVEITRTNGFSISLDQR